MKSVVINYQGLKLELFPHLVKSPKGQNNVKLGNIASWSTLYGSKTYVIPELHDISVCGTCGKYCQGCESICYVKKSYARYTDHETGECSVIKSHAVNTLAIRYALNETMQIIYEQIRNARSDAYAVNRIGQSGEIETTPQQKGFADVAKKLPHNIFYQYTKAYDIIVPLLLKGYIPNNYTINISIYHEYGIEAFKRVMHLPNVKAYVIIDDTWSIEEYAKHGINITTLCHAYNEKGKLNHDITCDKCKKCFNRSRTCKVIGCYEH